MLSPILAVASTVAKILPSKWLDVLSRSPFGAALRILVNASVPGGVTEVAIAAGPLRGRRMRLDLKSEKYYWLGSYEPNTAMVIDEVCKQGDVVYDVGANLGYTALLFARAVGDTGLVVAFEPLPANAERITEHIRMNGLEDRVAVEAVAVSSGVGEERFLVHYSHGMGKLDGADGRDGGYHHAFDVATTSLDEYAFAPGRRCPTVVKIDIEGGGARAIAGMNRVLAEARPALLVELHGPEEREAVSVALRAHGYDLRGMRPGLPVWRAGTQEGWKSHVVGLPTGRATAKS